jgi:glyoxylase-like metal-dependent hydrolase (beta-lactamase superfamily II)
MKLTEFSENSHQLTRMGFVNCYLVHEPGGPREPEGFTLIDAGLSGSADDIMGIARKLQLPIRRILLTHAHVDHIGSLDALAAQLPGVAVAIGTRESRLLPRPPAQDLNPLPGEEPQCKARGGFPGARTAATHLLNPGELFGSLRVLSTPGHTPGHMSFLDERDGTLYAGDALVTIGGAPHIPGFGPWYFPFPKFATWDRPTSVASIRNLLGLTTIARIAPGHGGVLTGGRNLLEDALRDAS